MRSEWLMRNGKENLLVFCTGWGMDCTPFQTVPSDSFDILVCYDYADKGEKPDIASLSQKYEKCVLLSWSMGVLYGQLHFSEERNVFDMRIALNGTLSPVDDNHGIPEEIFIGTLENMNSNTLTRFYRRMCRPAKILTAFLENKPQRTIDDQYRELQFIYDDEIIEHRDKSLYTHIVISEKDLIIPTANQIKFWQRFAITTINGCHFPFYDFESWEDLIEQSTKEI